MGSLELEGAPWSLDADAVLAASGARALASGMDGSRGLTADAPAGITAGGSPGLATDAPPGPSADASAGLTSDEAAARLAHDGANVLRETPPVPAWRRFVAQFADPLVYLLLAAIVISFTAWWAEGHEGVPYDVLVIALVVVANAILGFVQERRSALAVTALKAMAAPTALVRRDGEPTRIPAAEVVVGDLLLLGEGDAVPADARLIDGTLWSAEAALTGESAPVAKTVGAVETDAAMGDRTCMVFAGTAITRGAGTAVITATAMDTETGRIAALLSATEAEPTPLQREIARLGRTLGIAVVVIAIIVMTTVFLTRDVTTLAEIVSVLLLGVALAVAAVPEGLPAIMSVVLALGVQRMARRHAIVKDLASVETLGSASVICSDKTGTLTQNRMSVRRIVTASGVVPAGKGARRRALEGDTLDGDAAAALAYGVLASDAVQRADGDEVTFEGDPTETALLEAEHALRARAARDGLQRVGSVPFSAERRRMSVVAARLPAGNGDGAREGQRSMRAGDDADSQGGDDASARAGEDASARAGVDASARAGVLAVKGAPDAVLPRCTRALVDGRVTVLDDATLDRVTRDTEELAAQGMRTLAIAYRPLVDSVATLRQVGEGPVDRVEALSRVGEGPVDRVAAPSRVREGLSDKVGTLGTVGEGSGDVNGASPEPDAESYAELEQDLVLAGVVGIVDPPRDEARSAVAAAQGAGIRVVMITGDHPATALAIASELGIVPDAEAPVLAGAALARMSDAELREAAPRTAVFARVAPEDKLRIVDALQSHGEVVAMTGDGVNDAPALRSADIGVAMGRGGTEVAREAAAMILTDDDFATIVKAVREGRGILDNITRFLRYLLASNLGEVLTVFVGVVAAGVFGFATGNGTVVAPLLATQILWINLLTDLGPALAVSAERYSDDLMERKPRPLGSPLVDGAMWRTIAWTGAWMALVTLVTFDVFAPGGLIEGTHSTDTARTAAFTVLVLAHLTNAFSARSDSVSLVHRLGTNPWLWGAVALSTALQVAVVHIPALNAAFTTTPLTLAQWGSCLALATVVPLAIEARKAWLRARQRTTQQARR